VSITATFAPGTNPDIAQVQVQNKVQQSIPQLPAQVQQQGVTVAKSQPSFLMVVGLYDTDGRHTDIDIADIVNSRFVDPLARIDGWNIQTMFPCRGGSRDYSHR
jgi:multidrug efflux pump subunit AcrB